MGDLAAGRGYVIIQDMMTLWYERVLDSRMRRCSCQRAIEEGLHAARAALTCSTKRPKNLSSEVIGFARWSVCSRRRGGTTVADLAPGR